jgi:hypothetical protein
VPGTVFFVNHSHCQPRNASINRGSSPPWQHRLAQKLLLKSLPPCSQLRQCSSDSVSLHFPQGSPCAATPRNRPTIPSPWPPSPDPRPPPNVFRPLISPSPLKPSARRPPPTAYCLLPTAYCPLPANFAPLPLDRWSFAPKAQIGADTCRHNRSPQPTPPQPLPTSLDARNVFAPHKGRCKTPLVQKPAKPPH